jgi:hypothetical protein
MKPKHSLLARQHSHVGGALGGARDGVPKRKAVSRLGIGEETCLSGPISGGAICWLSWHIESVPVSKVAAVAVIVKSSDDLHLCPHGCISR